MAEKEKEKDGEGTKVSTNGDVMKDEKDGVASDKPKGCSKEEVVTGASKSIVKDVNKGEEDTNEAVESAHDGKGGSDEEDAEEEDKKKVGTKKRRRGVSKTKEKGKEEKEKDVKDAKREIKAKGVKKRKEPATPAAASIERPSRERKSVERFVISSEKDLPKEFLIEKGRGTQLKDIPNVAYKLSKRRTDDVLKMLHTILYGRRGKSFHIKSNISQFSGFVWGNNEEKQKARMKEKLDKCVKSRLLEFCELLDMPSKATDRKEDLVSKLVEFIEAPHATTDVLLAEKEKPSKGKKLKRDVRRSSDKSPSSSGRGLKQKDEDSPKVRRKRKPKVVEKDDHNDEDEEKKDEEGQKVESLESEGDATEESGESDQEDTEEKSEDKDIVKSKSAKKVSKKSPEKSARTQSRKSKNATTSKLPKSPSKSSSRHTKTEEKPGSKAKVFSRKKDDSKKEDKPSTPQKRKRDYKGEDKPSASKKVKKSAEREGKPSTSSSLHNGKTGKKNAKAKGGADKKGKTGPTEEELRNAICNILKEVDFNTATFTDILKQLAAHFETDLMPRKAEVKGMIQDELTKLADDAEDESDDEDDEEGDGDKEDDE